MPPPRYLLPNRSAVRDRCPVRAFFPAAGSPLISDFLFLVMRSSASTLPLAKARASEATSQSRDLGHHVRTDLVSSTNFICHPAHHASVRQLEEALTVQLRKMNHLPLRPWVLLG